jgi:hypothetical protein
VSCLREEDYPGDKNHFYGKVLLKNRRTGEADGSTNLDAGKYVSSRRHIGPHA